MSIPLPFATQYECRNETLEVYASDRRGLVDYSFNNYGYRNNIDYHEDGNNIGIYLGSSITSGIGVDWSDSFVAASSQALGVQGYHFSQGCVPVDNQETLRMLVDLKASNLQPRYWVIQFIDLNRRYANGRITELVSDPQQNLDLFVQMFHAVETILQDDVWVFTGCDSANCAVPTSITSHSNCVGWNVPFVDHAGVGSHPGPKWHRMISAGIVKKLRSQLDQA